MDWAPAAFENVKIIDSGTFGTVYEATSKVDKRTYAVKRIRVREGTRVGSYLREVKALAEFDHRGIVTYNHAWKEMMFADCVHLCIQMELCHGTLEKWLSENQQRDLDTMKLWFKQIVSAVGYIHDMNRTHRDLKPSNILFAGQNWLKVCDLGTINDVVYNREDGSQEGDPEQTARTGTPMYMAPEQTLWQYTNKVDIFTLGLIFAELCVPMTKDDAAEEEFVSWQTNVTPSERPSCQEILNGIILTDCVVELVDNAVSCEPEALSFAFVASNDEDPSNILFAGPNCLKVCDLGTINDVAHVREDGGKEVDPEQSADQGTTTIWTVDNNDHATKMENHSEFGEPFKSKFLEDFEPIRMLPNAGFGTVFEARNLLDNQIYAVKRIAADERYVKKALVEAQAHALLQHEGIVRYFAAWIEKPPAGWQHERDEILQRELGAHKFQAMYHNWFAKDSAFLYIKMQLCKCRLSYWVCFDIYLHAREIIYRDLQPNNILISFNDRVKLCDFGITTEEILKLGQAIEKANEEIIVFSELDEIVTELDGLAYMNYMNESGSHRMPRMHLEGSSSKRGTTSMKTGLYDTFMNMRNELNAPTTLRGSTGDSPQRQTNAPKKITSISSKSTKKSLSEKKSKVYIAPEQIGDGYTVKVDVFALGLILTELCVVVTDNEAAEVFNNYRAGNQSTVLDKLPEVKQIVSWLTNKEPTERPTCEDIIKHPFLI